MTSSTHISAYTPSNTDPEIRESIFVQRHHLLKKIVGWCEASILTDKKNHLLFIGPRGCGKTHLVSMAVYRLQQNAKLKQKMQIVWLGEDLIITSLFDLMLAILENLVKNDPQHFNQDCLNDVKGQKNELICEVIMHHIKLQLKDQTMLLIKENMNEVFAGLKDDGQKKLRAFFQETNQIASLTTSQQLFSGVSSRDAAFFGFFDTHHLKPLNVDEARQLISNIAALNHDQALVDFLATEQGEFRIRALHHLAGGNHRLYVELADFLTMESLNNFVDAIVELADNLTPYFQERIHALPPQQGKIVQKLCDLRGATPVKIIAEATFINERSAAKQLGELAKKGYVISHKRGKQSYYEMAEPLMRLSIEAKNSQGEPLKMVTLLLRTWFSDQELAEQPEQGLLSQYKKSALAMGNEIIVKLNNYILDDILTAEKERNSKRVIKLCGEIISSPDSAGKPSEQKAIALVKRAITYFYQNQLKEAEIDLITFRSIQNSNITVLKNVSVFLQYMIYEKQEKVDKALKYLDKINKLKGTSQTTKTIILFIYPELYFKQLKINKAHQALEKAFQSGESGDEFYSFNTESILETIIALGASFWQKEIQWLVSLYQQYDEIESLATALIDCIAVFAADKTLLPLLEKWQTLWQTAATDIAEMQISLQAVEAAHLALEQQSDKPLFVLPQEIRALILPLIEDALPKNP